MSGVNQPCGCQDQLPVEFGQLDAGASAIPPLAEFEQKLQAIGSASMSGDLELNELDLIGLDASLGALEELSLDEGGEDVPSLSDLLRLLERFPGLKLSLSY